MNSKEKEFFYNRGKIYYNLNLYEEAQKDLENVVKIDKKCHKAWE
jgi:tetratricopeptide (TPR) repeat protein